MSHIRLGIITTSFSLLLVPQAWAAPSLVLQLVIKNQSFEPQTLTIPAGQQVEIMVKNGDAFPAEFESTDINREKVIPGGTTLPLYVGPLSHGSYRFFNDFHPSGTGTIIVVPPKH
jgi:plastocyanin